jgi:lathosterol oxidase
LIDFGLNHSFSLYAIAAFGLILARYFLVAGGTYWLFYVPWGQALLNRPQPERCPSWRSVQPDIQLSVLSAAIFAIATACILSGYSQGLTRLYSHSQTYGLWYLAVSYVGVLVLQDTYFYFTHRLFHHPRCFSWFHKGHHRSRYPTPWTSFAFDPLEAVIQSCFLVVVVMTIPLHFVTLLALLVTMTVWAALSHLGVDRLPAAFPHHWLGRWFIGPAHHSIHHLRYTVHYGLYFTFWDHWLGSHDPNYDQALWNRIPSNINGPTIVLAERKLAERNRS